MTAASPLLLTPGPLTTSAATKEAMLRDWGSRDEAFIALTERVRRRLVDMVHGEDRIVAVPVQGSGTFAVEATIGTLVPRDGKLLVLVNGAYGKRMVEMTRRMGRAVEALETPEDRVPDLDALDAALAGDAAITHVAAVHCETTSGILNPIEAIATIVARHRRGLIIDAMSAFGALPIDSRRLPFAAVVASSNKCLEGVPGLGFALIERETLGHAAGNCHSLSLDLHAQWKGFEANGQWRFTPPTHVLAAFDAALDQHAREGGVAGRGARYAANHKALVSGMRALGFETLLPDHLQAPIIVTFHRPADPAFDFERFYRAIAARGFLIYPGKLTVADSFRVGCIGQVFTADIARAIEAMKAALAEQGVTHCGPAKAA
jgi:2-aminoethylphosphonate-pyruvate transaminase